MKRYFTSKTFSLLQITMIGNEQQMYQYLLLERSIFNQVMKLE